MKRLVIPLLLLLFFSCGQQGVDAEKLPYLNGYWEIQKVGFPDGTVKEYRANTMVDFIRFEEKVGIRKKVQPRLDGTYIVSGDEERFTISKSGPIYSVIYSSGLNERQEKLISVDSLSFATKNEAGLTYFYKRFEPFSIKP